MRPRLLLPYALLALAALAGCAAPRRLENPAGWPARWDDRTLSTTSAAYIYARTEPATTEISRLLAAVARDYEHDAQAPPPPVLVIVHDIDDPAWRVSAADLLVAAVHSEATIAAAVADRPADVDKSMHDALQQTEEAGISLDVLVSMMPLFCDQATLRDALGAPPALTDHATVAIVLPTAALVRQNTKRMLRGALDKQDVGPVAQTLLAPMLAFVEAKMAELLATSRDVTLYEYWASTNPNWTDEQKKQHADAYQTRRLGTAAQPPEPAPAEEAPPDSQPAQAQ